MSKILAPALAHVQTALLTPDGLMVGEAVAKVLQDHAAWFHTDAAQGFGKEIDALQNPRLDLISISGHKILRPPGDRRAGGAPAGL